MIWPFKRKPKVPPCPDGEHQWKFLCSSGQYPLYEKFWYKCSVCGKEKTREMYGNIIA